MLAEIKSVSMTAACPNVFIGGDLNCHFNRGSRFTNIVKDCLVDELGLTIMWENPDPDPQHSIQLVDYTHMHTVRNASSFSVIDHFAVSPQVYAAVNEAESFMMEVTHQITLLYMPR